MTAMPTARHPELEALARQLDAVDADAARLVDDLDEARGTWRAAAGTWSVAECLDHLAVTNRVFLEAMRPAAEAALAGGRQRRRPAVPGAFGRWFVGALEPPVKRWLGVKAKPVVQPQPSPSLADAVARFAASQAEVRAFIDRFAGIDLAGVRFPNPIVPLVRYSLATALHVIPAHERRHLWQAWNVRRAAASVL